MDLIEELNHVVLGGFGALSTAIHLDLQQLVDWDYDLGVKWNRTGEHYYHFRGYILDWYESTVIIYYNNRIYKAIDMDETHTYYEKCGEWAFTRISGQNHTIENSKYVWLYEHDKLTTIYYKNHPYVELLIKDKICTKRRLEGGYMYPTSIIKRITWKNKITNGDKNIYPEPSKFRNSVLWNYNYGTCTHYGELLLYNGSIPYSDVKLPVSILPKPCEKISSRVFPTEFKHLVMDLEAPANDDPYKDPEFI